MAPRRRGERAAVRIARKIVSEIRRRRMRPGTQLAPEHVMVEKLGVARATVREALRLLELQGALKIKAGPGGGPVVDVPGPEHLASVLSLQLEFADASLRSVIEARKAIYPVLAAGAAVTATREDIESLTESIRRMHEAVDEDEILIEELRRFQELVAVASGNTVLALLVNALHRMSDSAGIVYDARQRRANVRGSVEILRAIESGDPDETRDATARLFEAGARYLERTAPDALKAPVRWSSAIR